MFRAGLFPHAAALLGPLLLRLVTACGVPASGGTDGVPPWPDTLPLAASFGAPRDYEPIRAIVHVHSVYSHDACDGKPQDEAERVDRRCLARFRRALCAANVDVVFLTEHDRHLVRADSLAEALLPLPGDTLLLVDGHAVASRMACFGRDPSPPSAGKAGPRRWGPILFAGAENALMPVGFDSLPSGTREERRAFYDADTAGAAELFHRFGAIVLLSHPEDLSLERIAALGPDGIEIYNPHSNFAPKHRESQGLSRFGAILDLLPFYLRTTSAHPDLALLAIFRANREALRRWDELLARRTVSGFGASDAHENALPWMLADGDRGDSYFRMIPWVTNVLLVEDRPRTDALRDDGEAVALGVKEALRRGRSYVAIEAWGTPTGFDFHLEGPDGVAEMGDIVGHGSGQRLIVEPPRVQGHSPGLPAPEIRMRLYRIDSSGSRTIAAESSERIVAPVVAPGAYRVEVGIVPRHLAPYLGKDDHLLREVVWIYSNPIRVEGPTRVVGGS